MQHWALCLQIKNFYLPECCLAVVDAEEQGDSRGSAGYFHQPAHTEPHWRWQDLLVSEMEKTFLKGFTSF